MIKMIVAITEDGGIGNSGDLLFKIPDDMKRFKQLTTGNVGKLVPNVVLMGSKTAISIGNPLPNRTNVVLTRDISKYSNSKYYGIKELDTFLNVHKSLRKPLHDIWIIGGGEIYNQTIQYTDEIYVTKIKTITPCDTYFPIDKLTEFVSIKVGEGNYEGLEYEYYKYYRNSVQ